MNKFEKHIQCNEDGITAIECLSRHCDLSKQQLKQAMQNGCVWLESSQGIDRVRRAKKQLQSSDILHIYFDESVQQTSPPPAKLISDEGAYSIWYKPGGMFSQGSKWGDHCTIYRWAEQHLQPQRPAFIVHRLDRAAQGLILIAHKKTVAKAFSKLFEERQVYKRYAALVEGAFENIQLPYEISSEVDNKPALSIIVSLENAKDNLTSYVEVEIKTGRKHQIREHLSAAGHPIIGDRLYGSAVLDQDLKLQSMCIAFHCPETGQFKQYEIPAGFRMMT